MVLHLFARQQPDLNWDNPEVREDFKTTLRFWADRGVDGYRVDVAHALAKDLSEPLRSKPTLYESLGTDGKDALFDRDEVHEIYAEWRAVFNEYDPPRTAVAEAFARSERQALYARPTGLGQAFNFDLLKADFDAAQFGRSSFCLSDAARVGSSSTWVLSNHDVVRHTSRYALPNDVDLDEWLMSDGALPLQRDLRPPAGAGGDPADARPAGLVLPLPGRGARPPRGVRPADVGAAGPDLARTLNTKKARRLPGADALDRRGRSYGFSTGPSWLPQPAGFSAYAVSAQAGQPESTLEMYRDALRIRRQLQGAEELEWVPTDNPEVLHFVRPGGWHCVTNFGTEPVTLPRAWCGSAACR